MRTGRAALAASYFGYFGAIGVFQPYWPVYLAALGYGAGAIGVLLAVFHAMRLVGPYLGAHAADRAGDRRRVLWALGAVASAATLLLTRVQGPFALAAGLALFSVAFQGLMPIVDTLSIERPGGSLRYGWFRLWGSLGFLACSAVVGAVLERGAARDVPWALVTLVVATTLALAALPAGVARRAAPLAAPTDAGDRRALARLLLVAFLHLAGFGAYYGFYTLYLARAGYAPATIGAYWSVAVLAEIGLFLAAPALLARVGPRPLLQLALAGTVLRWLLCAGFPEARLLMLGAQLLHALGFALLHVITVRLAPALVPASHAARAQALVSTVGWGAGGVAGSLLAGALWEAVSPAASFAAGAALSLAALGVSLRLRIPPTLAADAGAGRANG